MSNWDSLSMAQRADVMKLAIENGIYDLDTIRGAYNEFAKGGSIHIKPENRGKFTALKKRTGHSATWFKQHGTPAQRKMATFALNARKWKHEYGGNLYEDGNWLTGYESYNPQATKTTTTYAPNAKYGMNGKPYEQWASDTRAAAAVKEWADKQPQLKPMTMSSKERAIAKRKGDADALYAQKQDLQQKGIDALITLGTFARPSTWAALPFRGIEHFGEGFGTEWVNTPLDLALPLAWQGAVNTANTAANAWRYRGFNAGNTPKGLLANAEPLIARGTPQITAENAANITPEQWNTAYRAAYERGNRAEGQRLWNLWFKQKAPNNKVVSEDGLPIRLRHNTDSKPWNVYDESFFDSQTGDGGWYGKGLYATGNPWGEDAYGKNTMSLFVNMEKPAIIPPANISLNEIPDNVTTGYIARDFFNRGLSKEEYLRDPGQDFLELKEMYPELASKAVENTAKADGIIVQREAHGDLPFAPFDEVVLPKGTHIKLAEPFTLDDNGNLIDLTKRANFSKNDNRYSWLAPFIGLGTLGTLYGTSNR